MIILQYYSISLGTIVLSCFLDIYYINKVISFSTKVNIKVLWYYHVLLGICRSTFLAWVKIR